MPRNHWKSSNDDICQDLSIEAPLKHVFGIFKCCFGRKTIAFVCLIRIGREGLGRAFSESKFSITPDPKPRW